MRRLRTTRLTMSGTLALLAGTAAFAGVGLIQPETDSGQTQEPTTEVEQVIAPVIEPEFERDGRAYPVSDFEFEYPLAHESLPDLAVYDDLVVPLVRSSQGLIAPVAGAEIVLVRLGDLDGSVVEVFYGSAIARITGAVRDMLESQYGLIGQLVTPSGNEIDFEDTREDLRPDGDTVLTIQIWRAVVGEVRTIGFGTRWEDDEQALNHPRHQRILDRAVLTAGDLLSRPEVDAQVHRLNRHPGRQVDIAIAPAGQAGGVVLDYLVTEAKDWWVYAQASNTGTRATDEWQYRFGYINNQVSGIDDVLQIDYITSGFDESHAVMASYERPLGDSEYLRGKVYGRWSQYTATDVGLPSDVFRGEGWAVGGEAIWNVIQRGPMFVDLVGGARWEHTEVENRLTLIEGDQDFFLPYVGARIERVTPLSSLFGEAMLEWNASGVAGTDEATLGALGRFGAEEDFVLLRGSVSYSFFLEPMLNPSGFRGEGDVDDMTLAHELALSVRGQTTFDKRVVPNFQQVAGGFFTVRGYEESIAVGDNAVLATAEYRYHMGRAVGINQELTTLFGKPFKTGRAQPYGRADWNVILRAFIDAAQTSNNDALAFERDETLVGVGVGIEGQIKNNLSVRLDLGFALSDVGPVGARRARSGDTRLHFSATVMF